MLGGSAVVRALLLAQALSCAEEAEESTENWAEVRRLLRCLRRTDGSDGDDGPWLGFASRFVHPDGRLESCGARRGVIQARPEANDDTHWQTSTLSARPRASS